MSELIIANLTDFTFVPSYFSEGYGVLSTTAISPWARGLVVSTFAIRPGKASAITAITRGLMVRDGAASRRFSSRTVTLIISVARRLLMATAECASWFGIAQSLEVRLATTARRRDNVIAADGPLSSTRTIAMGDHPRSITTGCYTSVAGVR